MMVTFTRALASVDYWSSELGKLHFRRGIFPDEGGYPVYFFATWRI